MKRVLGSVAALLGLVFGLGFAAERLHPAGIEGNLLLCGSRPPLSIVESFVEMAGQEKAKVVVLTVSEEADDADANPLADLKKTLQARKAAAATRLAAGAKGELDVEPLRQATGVWIDGGGPAGRLAALAKIPGIEKELRGVLQRGGVVAAHGAATPLLCQQFVKGSGQDTQTVPGWCLLPGFLFDPRPEGNTKPALPELLSRDSLRSLVGLTLSERAALLVRGRGLHGSDEGSVSFFLGKGAGREPRTLTLKPRTNQDLTLLRRCALARSEPAFPPKEAPVPEVPSGALVIVGGGGMPPEVTREFIELAGGPEALIVVLPTAQPDPVPLTEGSFLQRAGAKNVIVLPGRDLRAVEDPNNLETLKKAKGIWFGGGRQWRFVDAYEGTKALELFRDVLKRGGVIGGSSAGATIQGDYLCRGSPFGNEEIMCEGYERGLGFLPGTAIDQHFSQRNRFPDMAALKKTYPQLLGIGIDETTALIVRGHVGEVIGKGQVHFFDRTKPIPEGKPDHESVKAGGRYDLKERKTLPPKGKEPRLEKTDLFEAGKGGHKLYRIPGLVVTAKGTVLAYCEARKHTGLDWDDIEIMLRRSTDGGKTWSEPASLPRPEGKLERNPVALANAELGKRAPIAREGQIALNNPVAITDRNGAVHFLYCVDYYRCFYLRSDDDGVSFSKPVEITSTFEQFRKDYDCRVLATGPAHGIQLKTGRLVVPVWLSTGKGSNAHHPSVVATIYSDDGGKTWKRGDIVANETDPLIDPNETIVAELTDGRVMLNMRNESKANRRAVAFSPDGATRWTRPVFDEQLKEPICMASLCRFSARGKQDRDRLLFANPDNLLRGDKEGQPGKGRDRKNLTVKLSYDEGKTWPVSRVLEPGTSGYSDLAVGPDGTVYCLYERGSTDGKDHFATRTLTLARFNLEWLTEGKDTLGKPQP